MKLFATGDAQCGICLQPFFYGQELSAVITFAGAIVAAHAYCADSNTQCGEI